jgi:hypothetical protein
MQSQRLRRALYAALDAEVDNSALDILHKHGDVVLQCGTHESPPFWSCAIGRGEVFACSLLTAGGRRYPVPIGSVRTLG